MQALKRVKVDHHPCMFTTTSKNALKYAVAGMSCWELVLLHIVHCIAYVAAIAPEGSNFCDSQWQDKRLRPCACSCDFNTQGYHASCRFYASCYHYAVLSPGIEYLLCFCSFSYQIEGVEGHLGPGDKAACIPAGMPHVPAKLLSSI